MQKYYELLKQIILFGFVGLATLCVDVVVTTAVYNYLHVPAYVASGIGFMSGFFFNFPMNRKKVFKHSINDRFSFKHQIILYISLSIFNLLATSALVDLIVLAGLQIQYAKIIITAIFSIWNFIVFRKFIFSKK